MEAPASSSPSSPAAEEGGEEAAASTSTPTPALNDATTDASPPLTESPSAAPPAPPAAPTETAEDVVQPTEAAAVASSPTAPAAAAPALSPPPTPRPRPLLKGTLIGLFVVIDPTKQREKINLKRELETWGIHQRDLAAGEEVQLSLEQAFYVMVDLKRLEIYLPQQPKAKTDEGSPDAMEVEEEGEERPLSKTECWKAFRSVSTTFVKSVGSYRYFREQGFVVHGGLNLGLDYMLYRGSPQRYHAEFGVLLRYPPPPPPATSEGESKHEGEGEGEGEDKVLSWRDLHLLYRLIGEVRKTLILGHVRLGQVVKNEDLQASNGDNNNDNEEEEDTEVSREMARWYTGLSIYEVAITPWRAGTPLARMSKAARAEGAQIKGRGGGRGGGQGGGRRRGGRGGGGRGGGGGGMDNGEHPNKRQRSTAANSTAS